MSGFYPVGLPGSLAPQLGGDAGPTLRVEVVGVRRRVRTQRGLTVPVAPVASRRRPDVVMLPALGATAPEAIAAALERRDVADAQALPVQWAARGTRICAACGATFIVAAAGLLDGGFATTTWWLAPLFRARFPSVELDETRMVVVSGNVVTAGAALSHLDLALWLVRRLSPALATLVARYLVVEPRPSRAVHAIPDQLAHSDAIVERFERAVHLLRTTDATIDEIAADVGYSDGVTLRTLLRRKTGCGVRELRTRDWGRASDET